MAHVRSGWVRGIRHVGGWLLVLFRCFSWGRCQGKGHVREESFGSWCWCFGCSGGWSVESPLRALCCLRWLWPWHRLLRGWIRYVDVIRRHGRARSQIPTLKDRRLGVVNLMGGLGRCACWSGCL